MEKRNTNKNDVSGAGLYSAYMLNIGVVSVHACIRKVTGSIPTIVTNNNKKC